jgi:flagellar hook-basal body complex protein FliE
MDVSTLVAVSPESTINSAIENSLLNTDGTVSEDFDSILSQAMSMLSETNDLQNDAESEKIEFALGEADNAHDMQIAEEKALTALQYTIAVRDKLLDAYKELMNMQM